MGNVIVGHGQNGDLGHGTLLALHDARPFVQAGQIGIEVAGVSLTAGNLALGGGELPQGFAVAGHVGEDDQNVLAQIKGQILGNGQRCLGGDDTFHDGVARQIQQHDYPVHHVGGLEGALEIIRHVVLHVRG